ncbi:hypothetical protein COI95_24155 [Bacillus cereus]|nr:hypothetical protein COI61_25475 [Bacillus cereus]PFJ72989.1 hypothetical protein COI95_24155 [Bacillus cereus]
MKKWIKITSTLVIAIAIGIFTGYKVGTYAGSDVKEKQTERIKGVSSPRYQTNKKKCHPKMKKYAILSVES